MQMQERQVQSLGQEDLLEEAMAAHSSILAWRIAWTEEPGELQSMVSQRAGHSWARMSPEAGCRLFPPPFWEAGGKAAVSFSSPLNAYTLPWLPQTPGSRCHSGWTRVQPNPGPAQTWSAFLRPAFTTQGRFPPTLPSHSPIEGLSWREGGGTGFRCCCWKACGGSKRWFWNERCDERSISLSSHTSWNFPKQKKVRNRWQWTGKCTTGTTLEWEGVRRQQPAGSSRKRGKAHPAVLT